MRPFAILALLLTGACTPALKAQQQMVQNLQVQDAMRGYETASHGGDPLDLCVKAKQVRVAYEDAGETASATAWRAREREACRLAIAALGVKRPPPREAGR